MANNLHPKIKALKLRAAPINYSNTSINQYGALQDTESDLDKRIIKGYLCLFNSRNLHGEIYLKGAFAKSIRERGPGTGGSYEIKFLWQHKQDDPLSLFKVLLENDIGLYFETKPLDDVPSAQRALNQLRSHTLNNFSHGFDYVWDKMEYDEKTDSIMIKEAALYEGSVVTIPSEMGTYAVRSAATIETLYDDTEDFIYSLPRKVQMEAREIFARHKALIISEPLEADATALPEKTEPKATGIDYEYLLQNFKI